jgi:hypothetical protein
LTLHAVRRGLARILLTGMLAAAAGTVTLALAPTSAFASNSTMEQQFIAKMNAAREANGQRPYAVSSDLTSVARSHSNSMASKQSLYHNPSLTSDVRNWRAVGENVGEGPTVGDIHTAFMNSPEHRSNILDHDFTQVGVGVSVDSNGVVWVTEDFREPMSSSSGSTSSSTSTTTHHATAVHRSTTQRAPAQHVATVQRVASHPVTTPHRSHASRPAPVATPPAVLLARLVAMRAASASAETADPVSQTFSYLSTVTTLAS